PVPYGALLAALAVLALARLSFVPARRGVQVAGAALLAAAVGFSHAAWRADARLADALDREHENLVTRLTLQVTGLATRTGHGQRFEARVVHSPVVGVPSSLQVGWYGSSETALAMPGEVYSAAVVLKRPHGAWNPHGFDFEAWMFERGLRAGATVRGTPRLVDDRPTTDFSILVQRVRHVLRAAAQPALEGTRYGPVMLALALGDQAGVRKEDWAIFNRVGITHLVSISGSHVTMLAALAAAFALWSWKRVRWRGTPLAERAPAQVVAAGCALVVAWLYCLLAGWGVPAQ